MKIEENTNLLPQIGKNTELLPQIAENTTPIPQGIEEIQGLRDEIQPELSMQIRELQTDAKAIEDRLGMP